MNTIFDSIKYSLETSKKEIYGEYTEEEKKIIDGWKSRLANSDILQVTVFRDSEFLRNFLKKIPLEEQFLYFDNTCNYQLNKECNHDYVILTRRSVYSDIPKPETFWTAEHSVALNGLKLELPEGSPQRLYSYILVSTLGKLENHGLSHTTAGCSDGEIVIDPHKPFSDFIFAYKPEREIKLLNEYLSNGGVSLEELLTELQKTSTDRMKRQGLITEESTSPTR